MPLLNIDTNYSPSDVSIDTGEFLKACFGKPLTSWRTELGREDNARKALDFVSKREEGVKYLAYDSVCTYNFDNDLDSTITYQLLYPESAERDPYYADDVYILVEYGRDTLLYKTYQIVDSGFFHPTVSFEISYPNGSLHKLSELFTEGYSDSPVCAVEDAMKHFVWSEKYEGWLALYENNIYGEEIVVVRPIGPFLEDCSAT